MGTTKIEKYYGTNRTWYSTFQTQYRHVNHDLHRLRSSTDLVRMSLQVFEKINRAETTEALLSEFDMGDKQIWESTTRQEMKELYRLGKVEIVLPCSVRLTVNYIANEKFITGLVVHGSRQILGKAF